MPSIRVNKQYSKTTRTAGNKSMEREANKINACAGQVYNWENGFMKVDKNPNVVGNAGDCIYKNSMKII